MQHIPMNGKKPNIAVYFDHDCLVRNPKHSICFPLVGACAKTLTIPVAHMRDEAKFKEVFPGVLQRTTVRKTLIFIDYNIERH